MSIWDDKVKEKEMVEMIQMICGWEAGRVAESDREEGKGGRMGVGISQVWDT